MWTRPHRARTRRAVERDDAPERRRRRVTVRRDHDEDDLASRRLIGSAKQVIEN